MTRVRESTGKSKLSNQTSDGILIHEKAEDMPSLKPGPFTRLGDGKLLTVAGRPAEAFVSDDEGATWTPRPLLLPGSDVEPSPTGALVTTPEGIVVLAFANLAERNWTWDDDLKDAPGARLPTYVMRSLDGGSPRSPRLPSLVRRVL